MIQIYNPVFPACAGVIPSSHPYSKETGRIPRVCGGDPFRDFDIPDGAEYSPRVRG